MKEQIANKIAEALNKIESDFKSRLQLDNILHSFFKATLNYEIKENENSIKVISLEWLDGEWLYGIWYNGTWYNGVWRNGKWHKGGWIDGKWYDGK